MSLTSFIKKKEIRDLFASEFKQPRDKITGEIKAPPLTKHFVMIGTAFDYLLRFYLKYHNPEAKEHGWVAELSCRLIHPDPRIFTQLDPDICEIVPGICEIIIKNQNFAKNVDPDIREIALKNLNFAKDAYSKFLENGVFSKDILKSAILLAQLDPIYRAYYIDPNMGIVDNADIQDLRNLISLVNIEDFKVNSYCLLNPTFGEGSGLVGGADADIVIDNQLIDIKTTKQLKISRHMFNQIIGYYILGKIGGIGREKIDISNISEIGFYFSRYGMKYMYKVEEIIDFNSLPDFIDRFEDKAKKLFLAHAP